VTDDGVHLVSAQMLTGLREIAMKKTHTLVDKLLAVIMDSIDAGELPQVIESREAKHLRQFLLDAATDTYVVITHELHTSRALPKPANVSPELRCGPESLLDFLLWGHQIRISWKSGERVEIVKVPNLDN
jgi:hypothetical protein